MQTPCMNFLSVLLVRNIEIIIFIFFLSSKFSQKIRYVFNLAELAELVPMEYVGIPECIKQYVLFYFFNCVGSLYVDVQEVNIFQYSFFLILYKCFVTFVFMTKKKGKKPFSNTFPHKSPFS